jgi:hypothetical protein
MDEIRRRIALALPLALPLLKPRAARAQVPAGPGTIPASDLSIRGKVRNALELRVESLHSSPTARALPPTPVTTRTGEVRRTLAGYRGLPLIGLLDQAQLDAPSHNELKRSYVVARAKDDYTVVFSWCELYNTAVGPEVLVLFEKDGAPLPDGEGPIALVSTRDLHTGPRYVRWLSSLTVERA